METALPSAIWLLSAFVRVKVAVLPVVNGPLIVPVSDSALTPYSTSLICLAFAAGTVKLTLIVLLCPVAVAVTFPGASGGAAACTAGLDCGDGADGPAWLVAVTVYSYQELLLVTVKVALVVLPSTVLVLAWVHGPPLDDAWYSVTV